MKALVQGQIVPNGVLPTRACVAVEGEVCANPGVNIAKRHLLGRRTVDGERDERRVAVRGLSLEAPVGRRGVFGLRAVGPRRSGG